MPGRSVLLAPVLGTRSRPDSTHAQALENADHPSRATDSHCSTLGTICSWHWYTFPVHWAQFAVGTGTPFLTDVSTKLPHMEVKWFASLRQYLNHIGGSIELEDPGIPPIQRVNDAYIMDMVLASGKFKPAQIRQINYCRMYLQAVTISDISRANGMELDLSMRRGQPFPQNSTSRWHRFNQARPPQTAWTLWQKACLLWSDTTGQLSQQLGMWLYPANELRRQ